MELLSLCAWVLQPMATIPGGWSAASRIAGADVFLQILRRNSSFTLFPQGIRPYNYYQLYFAKSRLPLPRWFFLWCWYSIAIHREIWSQMVHPLLHYPFRRVCFRSNIRGWLGWCLHVWSILRFVLHFLYMSTALITSRLKVVMLSVSCHWSSLSTYPNLHLHPSEVVSLASSISLSKLEHSVNQLRISHLVLCLTLRSAGFWVNYGIQSTLESNRFQWQLPVFIQFFPAAILMIGIFFVP